MQRDIVRVSGVGRIAVLIACWLCVMVGGLVLAAEPAAPSIAGTSWLIPGYMEFHFLPDGKLRVVDKSGGASPEGAATWTMNGDEVVFQWGYTLRGYPEYKTTYASRGRVRGDRLVGTSDRVFTRGSVRKSTSVPLNAVRIGGSGQPSSATSPGQTPPPKKPAPKQLPVGAFVLVEGEVWITDPDGVRHKASLGGAVYRNAKIETGPTGRLQMVFADESLFMVGGNSEMFVDEFVFDAALDPNLPAKQRFVASLRKGAVRFVIRQTLGRVPARVDRDATIKVHGMGGFGIRGSDVWVRLFEDDKAAVAVVEGGGYSQRRKIALVELPGLSRPAKAGDYVVYDRCGTIVEQRVVDRDTMERDWQDRGGMWGLLAQGIKAHAAGKHQTAIRILDRALAIDPQFARAYRARADAWRALGDTAKAEADLRRAQELDAK